MVQNLILLIFSIRRFAKLIMKLSFPIFLIFVIKVPLMCGLLMIMWSCCKLLILPTQEKIPWQQARSISGILLALIMFQNRKNYSLSIFPHVLEAIIMVVQGLIFPVILVIAFNPMS